jgi:hypothetical protein
VATLNDDQWRLGHRRPWWQWNVITLFGALFVLIWVREVTSMSYTFTLVSSVIVFTLWVLLPELRHVGAVALQTIQTLARINNDLSRRSQAISSEAKFRAVLYVLVLLAWTFLLFEVFLK